MMKSKQFKPALLNPNTNTAKIELGAGYDENEVAQVPDVRSVMIFVPRSLYIHFDF